MAKEIVFVEGIDGCGKTTYINKAATPAQRIDGSKYLREALAECPDARPEHVKQFALQNGYAVICDALLHPEDVVYVDRSIISAVVYNGLPIEHALICLGDARKRCGAYHKDVSFRFVMPNTPPEECFRRQQQQVADSATVLEADSVDVAQARYAKYHMMFEHLRNAGYTAILTAV